MRKGLININRLASIAIFILLILLSMNFMAKFFYVVIILTFFLLINNSGVFIVTRSTFLLGVLSVILCVTGIISDGDLFESLKDMAFPICYINGALFIDSFHTSNNNSENKLKFLLWAFSIGYIIHVILNIWLNLTQGGIHIGRNTLDIWSTEVISATGQASLFILPIGFAISHFFSNTTNKAKMVMLVICAISFSYNLQLACRTPIVVAIIIMAIAIVFMMKSSDIKKKRKQRVILWILLIASIGVILFELNIFGIRAQIESSNLFFRLIGLQENRIYEGRMDLRLHYVREIWKFPFGGSNLMQKYGYAHDLYFDTWDKAGFFAFVCVIMYIVSSIIRLYKVIRNSKISFNSKQMLLCVYCAFYLEFLVEPVLYGMPWLFAVFCIIDGAVTRLLSSVEEK